MKAISAEDLKAEQVFVAKLVHKRSRTRTQGTYELAFCSHRGNLELNDFDALKNGGENCSVLFRIRVISDAKDWGARVSAFLYGM
jgi:hypothetical protein